MLYMGILSGALLRNLSGTSLRNLSRTSLRNLSETSPEPRCGTSSGPRSGTLLWNLFLAPEPSLRNRSGTSHGTSPQPRSGTSPQPRSGTLAPEPRLTLAPEPLRNHAPESFLGAAPIRSETYLGRRPQAVGEKRKPRAAIANCKINRCFAAGA